MPCASVGEFGVDLGVEGPRQHGTAGLGLCAGGIERDMGHDLGEIPQREIHGGHQAERGLGRSGRFRRATKRNDLTHRLTHADGESAVSVGGEVSGSG